MPCTRTEIPLRSISAGDDNRSDTVDGIALVVKKGQGYMDMTYFAISPQALSQRDLKIAIVFNYEAFCFEAWLAGRNRKINQQYWKLFKDKEWPTYRIAKPGKGVDSIVECDLVKGFELGEPEALTTSIETGVSAFIESM